MITFQLCLSLIGGAAISALSGYLGTLMLSKRMSVVAGPLAHLAFPGVAIAILFGFNIGLGVFPIVILGALFIWYIGQRTKLPMENLSAVIFAVGFGASFLFLPIEEAQAALVGKITQITPIETILIISLAALTFLFTNRIYNSMTLINVHEDLLKAQGKNVGLYNLGYLLAIAVTVGLGVYLVGGLITTTLIAIPAGASRNLSRSLAQYKRLAVVLGVLGATMGILWSHYYHYPTGPMIVICGAIVFFGSLLIPKKSE